MQDNQRQTHWAYVAGIMDADGCFMITKHKRKTPSRRWNTIEERSPTYMPSLKIAMIEKEAIEFIVNELGFGKYHLDGTRKDRPNSKPIYQWYLRGKRDVPKFLIEVIPFLKVKNNRAEFLLKFCEGFENCSSPYHGLSEKELDYREESYVKIRELNGNKVAATTNPRRRESVSDSLNS